MKKKNITAMILATTMLFTACGAENTMPAATESPAQSVTEYYEESPASVYEEPAAEAVMPVRNMVADAEAESYEDSNSRYGDVFLNADPSIYSRDYGEEYTEYAEKGFVSPVNQPLSTFAADVDTASYSNFRRMVNEGFSIEEFPAGAIRTEEMVNYFKFNYAKPQDKVPFGVTAKVAKCPWNEESCLMTLGITTNDMDAKDIPSSNIVFLIDTSGSMMADNKLPLIKNAMTLLCEQFGKDDTISIVTYANGINTVLEGMPGDKDRKIINAFSGLSASGGTYGEGGIERAYELAEEYFIKGGVNRVILCTDGDFNIGACTGTELEKLISEKKDSGIYLSVLGFGMGNLSDSTLETLADCGNGNYAYIDTLLEAKKVLIDEMTSTLVTVAKDVKFQVEFNPATVSAYRMVGYENRELAERDFRDDSKDGGEIGSGRCITIMYEFFPVDNKERNLRYQKSEDVKVEGNTDEYCLLSVAYKNPNALTPDTKDAKSAYISYPISVEHYMDKPDDDYKFASMVAMTSLALKDSDFLLDYTTYRGCDRYAAIEYAYNELKNLKLDDEYKEEFVDMLDDLLQRGISSNYSYRFYD